MKSTFSTDMRSRHPSAVCRKESAGFSFPRLAMLCRAARLIEIRSTHSADYAGQKRLRSMLIMARIDLPFSALGKASLLKNFHAQSKYKVDNLTQRVSTSLMRTDIMRALIRHAIGRSRAEVESDTSALLESITRARNHREIA